MMQSTAARHIPLKLSPASFKALLTIHLVVSIALIGDSAGYLAIAIRAQGIVDSAAARVPYEILHMLAFVFGVPLSFAALLTGLALCFCTKWGVFRYPWVIAKLLLTVSVILVGALVLRGGMEAMLNGQGGAKTQLIAGSAYDVLALVLASFLGVFKPGKKPVRQ
jgi:membrane-bound metal-dependent hydrolase YbcI (DUF457 family)